MIYFDYAASTPLLKDVLQTLGEGQKNHYVNPSAAHKAGRVLLAEIETWREAILRDLMGASPRSEALIFTSSATESNNHLVKALDFSPSDIWCHTGDHPSLVAPARWRAEREGIPLRPIPLTPRGTIAWDEWLQALKSSPRPLVLLTLVHNQTGVLFDWATRLEQVRATAPAAFIHADAVQAYAKYDLQGAMPHLDSLSLSSHKMGGPKGIGGLFVREPKRLGCLLEGGGHEYGKRSSTLAAPLIAGLHSAVQFWAEAREREYSRSRHLARELRDELGALSPRLQFPFAEEDTCPNILGAVFEGVSSDIILRCLEKREVMISSSSACSSKSKGRNPALDPLGWERSKQQSFFRISFGHATTEKEVQTLAHAFGEVLQEIAPLLK